MRRLSGHWLRWKRWWPKRPAVKLRWRGWVQRRKKQCMPIMLSFFFGWGRRKRPNVTTGNSWRQVRNMTVTITWLCLICSTGRCMTKWSGWMPPVRRCISCGGIRWTITWLRSRDLLDGLIVIRAITVLLQDILSSWLCCATALRIVNKKVRHWNWQLFMKRTKRICSSSSRRLICKRGISYWHLPSVSFFC